MKNHLVEINAVNKVIIIIINNNNNNNNIIIIIIRIIRSLI